jgi:hypothetical protein
LDEASGAKREGLIDLGIEQFKFRSHFFTLALE